MNFNSIATICISLFTSLTQDIKVIKPETIIIKITEKSKLFILNPFPMILAGRGDYGK